MASVYDLPEVTRSGPNGKFSAALLSNPEDPAAHNELGALLFQTGRPEEALSYLRRAHELSPGDETILANLACWFEVDGQPLEALRWWLSCYRANKSSLTAWTKINETVRHICQLGDASAEREARDLVCRELGEMASHLPALIQDVNELQPVGTSSPEDASDPEYQKWISKHHFTEGDRAILLHRLSTLAAPPRIHLLMAAGPEDQARLAETMADLSRQLFSPWRLTVLASFARPSHLQEPRFVEWIELEDNADAVAVDAVQNGKADWIAVVAPGDRLEPHWLAMIALGAEMRQDWHLLYCDEDCITDSGLRCDPQFKPDFNLDLLRSMPYLGRFCAVRRSSLDELAQVRLLADAGCYDLCLKVLDRWGEAGIGHIAEMLVHRRNQPRDARGAAAEEQDGMLALRDHLRRRGVDAEVRQGLIKGTFRVLYGSVEKPLVSILIAARDRVHLLRACIDSLLQKTEHANYELLVADGSLQPEIQAYLQSMQKTSTGQIRVLRCPQAAADPDLYNRAAQEAAGEFLLVLGSGIQIVQREWLGRMLMHGLRPEVGVVGARLLDTNGMLRHAGLIVGMAGAAGSLHCALPLKDPGYMARAQVDQDLSAVGSACMLIRKSLFVELGGFDAEKFPLRYSDADLCLKVRERSLKVVWTPYAMAVQHELPQGGKAVREGESCIGTEQSALVQRWIGRIPADPAYSRHLSLTTSSPAIEQHLDAPWIPDFHDLPRIAGFPADRAGCGQYRVNAPLRALHRAGRAQCLLVAEEVGNRGPAAWEIARMAPDTVLLQGAFHDHQARLLRDYRSIRGLFKVFELDDLKTKIPPGSAYHHSMPRNIGRRLERVLAPCDRLIVTTGPLREACRKLIADIVVVPNYLERDRWAGLQSRQREGDRPRVGWAGGVSHGGDLALLHAAMKELSREVHFVLFGMCPKEVQPYVHEFHPGVSFDEYPACLAALDLDLALAPLEINAFNAAKSNLRLLEYGILGWPVVCTDIEPYRDAPVKRVGNRPRDWIEAIRERVRDLEAARQEGAALRRWVLDGWMLEDHLDEWLAALSAAGTQ